MEERSAILFWRVLRKFRRGTFETKAERLVRESRSIERTVRLVKVAKAVTFRFVLPLSPSPIKLVRAFRGTGSMTALSLKSKKRRRHKLVISAALVTELWINQRFVRLGLVKLVKDCIPPRAN